MADQPNILETDPRFPSGPWVGYFLQKEFPGKHTMELRLTFANGAMSGDGRDWVGEFLVLGGYDTADGKCHFHKRYVGKHEVFYQGYNEGKGIWGTWEINLPGYGPAGRGGFHIWPEGMGSPTDDHLVEEADLPVTEGELVEVGSPLSRKDPP